MVDYDWETESGITNACTATSAPGSTHGFGLVSMYPEKGMIAVDVDPIMRPWSIRDRRIRIRNQKRRKPDQEPKNNGADAWTTFVEQVE